MSSKKITDGKFLYNRALALLNRSVSIEQEMYSMLAEMYDPQNIQNLRNLYYDSQYREYSFAQFMQRVRAVANVLRCGDSGWRNWSVKKWRNINNRIQITPDNYPEIKEGLSLGLRLDDICDQVKEK